MNGLSYLLDTNIIIGLLKGNDEAVSILSGISLPVCGFSPKWGAMRPLPGSEYL